MSDTGKNQLELAGQLVQNTEQDFQTLAKIHKAVNFEREASFAVQAMAANRFLLTTAMGNKDSLKQAVLNVAAVGLTLSPVYKYGYLVPRDKKVCLDISYRGYIKLAVDCGAIRWAVAEIVYKGDDYQYRGIGREPLHEFNPFSDKRCEIIGSYCVAKIGGNEFIVTQMSIDEIQKIRNRSAAWRAYEKDKQKKCPWVTDESEMIKKTVIRRAWKSWPLVESKRFEQAVEVSNEIETIDYKPVMEPSNKRDQKLKKIQSLMDQVGRPEDKFFDHITRVYQREIISLKDLTDMEIERTITMLNQFVSMKKGKKNENIKKSG